MFEKGDSNGVRTGLECRIIRARHDLTESVTTEDSENGAVDHDHARRTGTDLEDHRTLAAMRELVFGRFIHGLFAVRGIRNECCGLERIDRVDRDGGGGQLLDRFDRDQRTRPITIPGMMNAIDRSGRVSEEHRDLPATRFRRNHDLAILDVRDLDSIHPAVAVAEAAEEKISTQPFRRHRKGAGEPGVGEPGTDRCEAEILVDRNGTRVIE
ncbi:MAG: hypothetical protein CBB77_11010 [Hyphomonas sp. TMED17]|nr:MAG: hypothetical protein CBB77_11010 [Hyphomonas sp. TMED17]